MVWQLSVRWRTAVDRAVAPFGLTHAQYVVLASLYGLTSSGQRPSQRQLADSTGLRPIFVSKLVRALEADGFVESERSASDARAVRLGLTEHGTAVAREAMEVVRILDDRQTAVLADEGFDVDDFRRMVQVLLAATDDRAG